MTHPDMAAALGEYGVRIAAAQAALAALPPDAALIGQTPSDVILTAGKARLRRYRREGPAPLGPVLFVYGLVGRYTLIDLEPRRSLVQRLLAAGADVHVIDWEDAGQGDEGRDLEAYQDDLAACVAALGGPQLIGVCEGGIFALIHAAQRPETMGGLALLITPVDFHADDAALLTRWARSLSADEVEVLVRAWGNLPGPAMGALFQAATPGRSLERLQSGLLDAADDPERLATFLRTERWLADRPDHPGAAARRLLTEFYGENRLARGALEVGGRAVTLSAIRGPALNVYGRRDEIAPPACCAALKHLVRCSYRELAVPAGHGGVIVSARAGPMTAAAVIRWLKEI